MQVQCFATLSITTITSFCSQLPEGKTAFCMTLEPGGRSRRLHRLYKSHTSTQTTSTAAQHGRLCFRRGSPRISRCSGLSMLHQSSLSAYWLLSFKVFHHSLSTSTTSLKHSQPLLLSRAFPGPRLESHTFTSAVDLSLIVEIHFNFSDIQSPCPCFPAQGSYCHYFTDCAR